MRVDDDGGRERREERADATELDREVARELGSEALLGAQPLARS